MKEQIWEKQSASSYDLELTIDSFDELEPMLKGLWNKCRDHLKSCGADSDESPPRIRVEIWPDSGRIVAVLLLKREVGRLVVTVPYLEEAYYLLPEEENLFEKAYSVLRDEVAESLGCALDEDVLMGFSQVGISDLLVSIHDCDEDQILRRLA